MTADAESDFLEERERERERERDGRGDGGGSTERTLLIRSQYLFPKG